MSTAAPSRPAERAAPRGAAAVTQPGFRLDPIRVLRQNQWKIILGLTASAFAAVAPGPVKPARQRHPIRKKWLDRPGHLQAF